MSRFPRLLSTAAAAKRIGCSRATVRRLLHEGKLVGQRGGKNGHYRLDPEVVDFFVDFILRRR